MRKLLILALLLCSSLAQAQVVSPKMQTFRYSGKTGIVGCTDTLVACPVLSAVALNGAAGTRTMLFKTAGYSTLGLSINYTYSAATSLTATCYKSRDFGATYAQFFSVSIVTGVGTNSAYTDVLTGTSSVNWPIEFDTRSVDWVKCVLSGGGSPGAGDLVTTYAVASVGQ